MEALLGLVRAKFDTAPHPLGLAARLLLARDIKKPPRMVRPLAIDEMVAFFEAEARRLTRSE